MARAKSDAVLAAAVEPARRELLEATKGEGVGEHVGFTLDAERLSALYPRHGDFVAVRDRLDPDRVLTNDYLDRVLGP